MMSDEEFLDGIYKKAEAARRREHEESRPGHIRRRPRFARLAPVLLFCVLAVAAVPLFSRLHKGSRVQAPEIDLPDPASLRLPAGPEGRTAPIPAPLIIYGTVTEAGLTDQEWKVSLRVKQVYSGEAGEEITFLCPKEAGFAFEEGEEGLYYLEKRDDEFILANGDYGKYTYIGEENGSQVFEAKDGARLTSDILNAGP